MLTKSQVKKQIDNFPEEFSLDELIEKLNSNKTVRNCMMRI